MFDIRNVPELLDGFRRGDAASLATIYEACSPELHRRVGAMARAHGAPELAQPGTVTDLVHDSFLRAFSTTARQSYDDTREFGPYLNTIARNCVMDALRAKRRQNALAAREVQEANPVIQESVLEDDADAENLPLVEQYLSTISESLQAVYEQRFVRGNSQVAASTILGITRRSLRTRERHLQTGLKRALVSRGLQARAF